MRNFLLVVFFAVVWADSYASCPTCSNPNLPGADGDRLSTEMVPGSLRIGLSIRSSLARSTHEPSQALAASGAGDSMGRTERSWDYKMLASHVDIEHAASKTLGWAVTIPVRYMKVTEVASAGGNHGHPATHYGIGDMSLFATGYLRPDVEAAWWVSGRLGFTVPTGNTLADPSEATEGEEGHEHIFFGSGTIDPRALMSTGYRFDDWTFQANVHYRTALYDNRHGYRGGTQFGAGIVARSGLGLESWSFGLRGEGFYATASEWTHSGTQDLFSGKSGLLLGLEAQYQVNAWEVSLGLDRPFVTSTVDGHFEVPAILKLGLAHTL